MTDEFGNTETRTYDAAGRLASILNRNGLLTTFAYNTDGQLITKTWYDGATDTDDVVDTFEWTYTPAGQIASASNAAGEYDFQYNAYGQVTHVDEPFSVSLDFVYDASGNRILVKDSLGGVETSLYNGNQLIRRTLTQGTEELRIDFTYDQFGRVLTQTRFSDAGGASLVAVTTFSYNAQGALTEILTKDSEDATISEYDYTYDLAGQLTAVTEFQDGLDVSPNTINYGYDEQGQLTDDDVNSYDYDLGGNRDTGYTYVENPDEVHETNWIANDGVWDYTYDLDGNLTEKSNASGSWVYAYDHERHLIQAKQYDDMDVLIMQADYKYDVFGNRIEKDVDLDGDGVGTVEVQKFAIDGWNPAKGSPIGNENNDVWADLDGSGSLITHYLRGDIVDQIIARTDGTDSAWLLTDHLGSTRDIIDNTGALKDNLRYDGFGNIIDETDDAERGRYAWTGREYDVETDLQYNRARYYDPTTGRWISQDPLGFDAGDSNLYRYVANRATGANDPSGLQQRLVPISRMVDGRKLDFKVGLGVRRLEIQRKVGTSKLSSMIDFGGDLSLNSTGLLLNNPDPNVTGTVENIRIGVGMSMASTYNVKNSNDTYYWAQYIMKRLVVTTGKNEKLIGNTGFTLDSVDKKSTLLFRYKYQNVDNGVLISDDKPTLFMDEWKVPFDAKQTGFANQNKSLKLAFDKALGFTYQAGLNAIFNQFAGADSFSVMYDLKSYLVKVEPNKAPQPLGLISWGYTVVFDLKNKGMSVIIDQPEWSDFDPIKDRWWNKVKVHSWNDVD